MKADSFFIFIKTDFMKKPKEIIALEKVYNIKLQQTFVKDDIVTGENTNLFFTDKKNEVVGLNLSDNNIESIRGFENFNELLYLNLYKNSLKVVNGLQALFNLEILIISNNKIVKLNEIPTPKLKMLNLSHNCITKIKGFEKLKNLEELYLTGNQIKEMNAIDNLKSLKTLKIDFNALTEVDFQVLSNCNIIHLDLRNNWINKYRNLEVMKEIKHLNLTYNKINEVEIIKEILNLKKLNFINVEGNPFLDKTDLELCGCGYENHLDDLRKYFSSQC